jgi:hypothetical protein
MSIAEDLSLGLLIEITDARLPTSAMVTTLWEDHVERHTDTWSQRLGVWKNLHGIAVKSSFPRYGELDAFVEARNAIVHGLGSLSPKQLRDPAKSAAQLRAAGITLIGTRLTLDASHVTRCGGVLRDLVVWLDQSARALPSEAA